VKRPFFVGLLATATAVLAVAASAAFADGNGAQTFTQLQKDIVQSGPAGNPCTGDPGTLTTISSSIFHVTANAAGGEEATLTVEGKAQFVPDDPNLPAYTGQFVNFFGHDINLQNEVEQFTSNIEAVGSDGSHLKFHGNGVVTLNANGVVSVHFTNFFCS
jgi:hypothetical protein